MEGRTDMTALTGPTLHRVEQEERIGRVMSAAGSMDLDMVVLPFWQSQPGDGAFLSGHFPWARIAYLLLDVRDKRISLITTMASEAYWAAEALGPKIEVSFVEDPSSALSGTIGQQNIRVGISHLNSFPSVSDLDGIRATADLIDFTTEMQCIRSIKSESEVREMERGCRTARDVSSSALAQLEVSDMAETELFATIEFGLRSAGARQTHLLTSDRGFLRPPSSDVNIKDSTTLMVSVEFSTREGYWIEEGSTFSVGLEPDDDAQAVCEEAFRDLVKNLRPGVACADIALEFEGFVSSTSWRPGIWLGHGIGLDIAEIPSLTSSSAEVLQAGMVLAIHPHVVSSNGASGGYLSRTVYIGKSRTKVLGYNDEEQP